MSSQAFDTELKLVSSYLLSPSLLAAIRLLFALFALATLLFIIIWESVVTHDSNSFFSYFTNLAYIGICAYFFAAGTQTLLYAVNVRKSVDGYPLQKWPRPLHCLHTFLLTTVITFPFLVTIVYWILLASSSTFESPFESFSNISKHALNSAFALFEILLTNIGPMRWLHLPLGVIILLAYLGVAYITHATQGIYTYSFLDPKKEGKMLAVYIVGIGLGQVVIFLIVRGVIVLRERLTKSRTASKQEPERVDLAV